MRNLKRALSLALASVMMMGLMVVGGSAKSVDDFSDAGQISNTTAATINTEIGIFDGYDTGDFKPDKPVTRAEMAVIVAKMLYGKDVNQSNFTGTHPFTDVEAWAEGYVNLCNSLGIVVGRGNGIFDPNSTVTTAEASVMLAKALGYFQNESDFGDSWVLAAIAKGTQLKLYGDLNLDANAPLTRDNVSEMVFNALTKASTVEYNGTFNMYYTTGSDFANGTKFRYSETLGYKNFDLVYDDTVGRVFDDFGRPATVWGTGTFNGDDPVDGSPVGVNINPRNEIITTADKPDATWTSKVTSKALYDAIGSKAFDGYTWTVYVDGDNSLMNVAGSAIRDSVKDNRNNSNAEFLNRAGAGRAGTTPNADWTANGVLTEVYVDPDITAPTVTVVIVNTYVAEVLKVSSGKITLNNLSQGYSNNALAKRTDEFETDRTFNEDDIVLYTYADGDIQSVEPATRVEGTVSTARANTTGGGNEDTGDYFVMDGTTYRYTSYVGYDQGAGTTRLISDNVDNDMVGYLDSYGYVIYVDQKAASYSYAYVLDVGQDATFGGGNGSAGAYLVLTDGSIVTAKLSNSYNTSLALRGKLVSYTVDKAGVYSLSDKSALAVPYTAATAAGVPTNNVTIGAGSSIIENGKAAVNITGTGTYVANSETIFVLVDPDPQGYDDYDVSVYTGIKNVPDVKDDGSTRAAVVRRTDGSNVAKVVYIEGGEISGSGKVYFAVANSTAKLVKSSGDNSYYEIDAIIDGAKETLKIKENSSAADKLVKAILANMADTSTAAGTVYNNYVNYGTTKYVVALKSVSYNSDGLVTNVTRYDGWDNAAGGSGDGAAALGAGTYKTESSTVGLGGSTTAATKYGYGDDINKSVGRYVIDSDSVTADNIRSVKTDANDLTLAVFDENVLVGLFVVEVADAGTTSGATAGAAATVSYTASALANGNAVVNLSATRAAFVPSTATVSVTYDVYANGTLAAVNQVAVVPTSASSIRDTVFGLGLEAGDTVTIDITDITPSAVTVRYYDVDNNKYLSAAEVYQNAAGAAATSTLSTTAAATIRFGIKSLDVTPVLTWTTDGLTTGTTGNGVQAVAQAPAAAGPVYQDLATVGTVMANGDDYVTVKISGISSLTTLYSVTVGEALDGDGTSDVALSSYGITNAADRTKNLVVTFGAGVISTGLASGTNFQYGDIEVALNANGARTDIAGYLVTLKGTDAVAFLPVGAEATATALAGTDDTYKTITADWELDSSDFTVTEIAPLAVVSGSWDAGKVVLTFNRALENALNEAETIGNYTLTGVTPANVTPTLSDDGKTVTLTVVGEDWSAADTVIVTATIVDDVVAANAADATVTYTLVAGGVLNNGTADLPTE